MTTGANCSAPSTASRTSPRPTFGASPTRHLSPGTGQLGSSNLWAGLHRERLPLRKGVDSEAPTVFLRCDSFADLGRRQCSIVGAGDKLEADSNSQVACV